MKRPRTRFAYASASYSTVNWRLGYMRRTHYHLPAGRGGEAIPLHKRTLADRERVLGADHLQTLTTRANLERARAMAVRPRSRRDSIPVLQSGFVSERLDDHGVPGVSRLRTG